MYQLSPNSTSDLGASHYRIRRSQAHEQESSGVSTTVFQMRFHHLTYIRSISWFQ